MTSGIDIIIADPLDFNGGSPVSKANPMPVQVIGGAGSVNGSVSVTNFPAVQPVSQNSGPWTVSWSGQSVGITGSVAVTGTFYQATQPVSLTTLPSLPAGSAAIGTVGINAGSAAIGTVGVTALPAIPSGNNFIGAIGGTVAKFQTQFGPGSSTTYTAGQAISGLIQLTGMARVANGTGLITGATLTLNAANTVEVDLVIFSSAPTGTYTAGTTFAVPVADQPKVSKAIQLISWTALGASASVGEPNPLNKLFRCDDATNTTSLWCVAVARGSITLAAATDATLTVRTSQN